MARVGSIYIGSYAFKDYIFERKDEDLLKLALYAHSEEDLIAFLRPLIVKVKQPQDKIITLTY